MLTCPECHSKNVWLLGRSNVPRYRRSGDFIHRYDVSRLICRSCGTHFEDEHFVIATKLERAPISSEVDHE